VSNGIPKTLLVITNCSALKRGKPVRVPTFDQLRDHATFRRIQTELSDMAMPARDQYIGRHHRGVLEAVDRLRTAAPEVNVEVQIVSGGFGLIGEYEMIIPYDAGLSNLRLRERKHRVQELAIHAAIVSRLSQSEAAVFVMSEAYLAALEAPFGLAPLEVYFAPAAFCTTGSGQVHVVAGVPQAREWGTLAGLVGASLFAAFIEASLVSGWDRAVRAAAEGRLSPPAIAPAAHPQPTLGMT
jgi:hypothetical protein